MTLSSSDLVTAGPVLLLVLTVGRVRAGAGLLLTGLAPVPG